MDESTLEIPKKKSVILLVILSTITLSIYYYWWFFKRVKELNNLETKKKAQKSLALISFILSITLVLGIVTSVTMILLTPELQDVITAQSNTQNLDEIPTAFAIAFLSTLVISLILGVATLLMSFRYRSILNESLKNKGESIKLSGILTFFLQGYYLQYEINRIIDDKENEKRTIAWIMLILIFVLSFSISAVISVLQN